jgi:hypothetical protein
MKVLQEKKQDQYNKTPYYLSKKKETGSMSKADKEKIYIFKLIPETMTPK